ncbi:MAG: prepilin-type N-terminal cleavage/methylation domain-containing protein [bacterium]
MPTHTKYKKSPAGFTLVELMLGIMILAVVVGAIQGTMRMGLAAYTAGEADMELYQSVRIGLNRVCDQLRSALSLSAFWRPADQIEMQMTWGQGSEQVRYGNAIEEEEQGKIQFIGSANEVIFARKVYGGTSNRDFDIQEVRLYVDSKRNQLRMELVRSLMDIKVASWYFAYLYQTKLSGQILVDQDSKVHRIRQLSSPIEPPLQDFVGDTGEDGRSFAIAEGMKSVEFSYYDGEKWGKSWNSNEILSIPLTPAGRDRTDQLDPMVDYIRQEEGLPAAVEITFILKNGDRIGTQVDIPGGSLNHLGISGVPLNESGTARPDASPGRRPGAQMYRRILRRRI